MHDEAQWDTEGTGIDYDEIFWADKDPAEWVGREFVGNRQLSVEIQGDNRIEYRVGLNELDELVIDKRTVDQFAPDAEAFAIDLAAAPDTVKRLANELFAEYVPEAALPWVEEDETEDAADDQAD